MRVDKITHRVYEGDKRRRLRTRPCEIPTFNGQVEKRKLAKQTEKE